MRENTTREVENEVTRQIGEWVTTTEAAVLLGDVSNQRVRQLTKSAGIESATQSGGRGRPARIYKRVEIESLVERRERNREQWALQGRKIGGHK